jgi:hypothetical protein
MKGRSLEEINQMFEDHVPIHQFGSAAMSLEKNMELVVAVQEVEEKDKE